jgi:hypothetical protein
MRTLFFLLLIANVSLFMWEFKHGAVIPEKETIIQTDNKHYEKITLVSDATPVKQQQTLPAPANASAANQIKVTDSRTIYFPKVNNAQATAITPKIQNTPANAAISVQAEPAKTTPPPAPAPVLPAIAAVKNPVACYKTGPVKNNKNYQDILIKLSGTDSTIKLMRNNEQKPGSYIVFIPATKKPNNPDAYLLMLKQYGLKDIYSVKSGVDKGQITLGTFSSEPRALGLQKTMQAKGVQASIKTQNKNKPVQYAMVKTTANILENLQSLKIKYPDFRIVQISPESADCQ